MTIPIVPAPPRFKPSANSNRPMRLATLNAAIAADSPDDILRNAALRSLGSLGDDKAVPVLREWAAIGKAHAVALPPLSPAWRASKGQ